MAASTSGEARPRVSTEEGGGEVEEGVGVEEAAAAAAATERRDGVVDAIVDENGAEARDRLLSSMLEGRALTVFLLLALDPGAGEARREEEEAEADGEEAGRIGMRCRRPILGAAREQQREARPAVAAAEEELIEEGDLTLLLLCSLSLSLCCDWREKEEEEEEEEGEEEEKEKQTIRRVTQRWSIKGISFFSSFSLAFFVPERRRTG